MPPKFSLPGTEKIIYGNASKHLTRTSPCEAACPAGNPIQKIHSLIEEDKFNEALAFLNARNPLAGITGRICPHPCESVCNRGCFDEALGIRDLERFVVDHADVSATRTPQKMAPSGKKIAIIGSGPAGMTCAYFSALLGHEVVIFEAEPVLGGIPRVLVPDFKLPKDVVDRQVGQILSMGIAARTNVRVGTDIAFETIQEHFDACLISVGTARDRQLEIAGAEHAETALSFLRQVNLGHLIDVGDRVVILGGGGVAFDCAFTARRLGASQVSIICVEGIECMCVNAEEIQQAAAENIHILNAKIAHEIQHEAGKATGVGYFEIDGFSFDECCRLSVERRSEEIDYLPADTVISAIGVLNDFSFLAQAASFSFNPQGTLTVDADTSATSIEGVFAAGDAVLGPSSVAEAIGSGRRSAFSIHNYLSNRANNWELVIDDGGRVIERMQDGPSERHVVEFEEIFNIWHHTKMKRQTTEPASVDKHMGLRDEMARGLGEAEAGIEAGRCLHCGHCTACGTCVEDCPGLILEMGEDGPEVAYPHECWHCGCCRIACPSGAIEYVFPLHMLV